MNMLNERVCHHQFGAGTIVEQEKDLIVIVFSEEYGTKKFVYPSAFERHLTLTNAALQHQIDDALRDMYAQMENDKQRQEEETQKLRDEEHRAVLEQKRATVKKRAPAKKKAPVKLKKDEKCAISE